MLGPKQVIYDSNYTTHPDYGGSLKGFTGSARADLIAGFERERAAAAEKISREIASLGFTTSPEDLAKSWWYPYRQPEPGDPGDLADLLRNGITAYQIDPALKSALLEISEPFLATIAEKRRQRTGRPHFPDNKVRVAMPTSDPEHRPLLRLLRNLFDEYQWDKRATQYFGSKSVKVSSAIFKVAGKADNAWDWECRGFDDKRPPTPARGLHFDAGGYFDMKIIFYLTETVDEKNGAFRYSLGTHLETPSLADMVTRNAIEVFCGATPRRQEQRRRFLSLPSDYRRRIDFGPDLRDGSEAMEALLGAEKVFRTDQADTVFFDTRGIHRGGFVDEGERSILQLTLRALN